MLLPENVSLSKSAVSHLQQPSPSASAALHELQRNLHCQSIIVDRFIFYRALSS
jgi:hypothetical protein